MSSFLPTGYGYVFGVLGVSSFMNIYLMANVSLARKKYGVEYPNLYADKDNKNSNEFNSVQRAHQNTLESYAIVMLQMILNGLVYPKTSAGLGFVWVIGRIVYGYGYKNGGPNGRFYGALLSHVADIPLLFLTLKVAYDLVNSKGN